MKPYSDAPVYTYCILNGRGHAKIGRSVNPESRLRALQVSSPDTLTLYGVVEGDQEQRMHVSFSTSHIRGEWFDVSDGLLAEFQSSIPSTISQVRVTEDRAFIRDNDGIPTLFCPTCSHCEADIIEAFWDEEPRDGGYRDTSKYLRLICKGWRCNHIFEVNFSVGNATFDCRRVVTPIEKRIRG